MDPTKRMQKIAERAKQRQQERQKQQTSAESTPVPKEGEVVNDAHIIPFPDIWAEPMRACPLAILRSALFGVVKRGRRQYLDNVELAAWSNITIRYTGQRLDQADLDVWMQAIHLFRHEGLGKRLHLSAHGFLKAIGRQTGKSDHVWLDRSFTRMIACAVRIGSGRYVYAGNLVHEFRLDKEIGHYVLSINPHLAALFEEGYSRIEWSQRQALGTKDLAKWLLGYISTHQATISDPHRIGLEKLQRLCGAEMRSKDFKYWTRRYMDELKNLESVTTWRFSGADNDTLEFIKPPRRNPKRARKNEDQGTG